ncbi:MAG: acetate kinase [Chthoniobacterales bacterium]
MNPLPHILVVNCGSSSLKFALLVGGEFRAEGVFERLGGPDATGRWKISGLETTRDFAGADHEQALTEAVHVLEEAFGKPLHVDAVGHRVVHGGEYFNKATLINSDVLAKIELCRDLAPLHNPAHAIGIRIARKIFPNVPHVAVFDTAFHQTMPEHAWSYALPYEIYKKYAVRRYGAHGTSHQYVAGKAAESLGRPLSELHLITAHLGNGCSACAIRDGKSVDTTMGLTPLEGLMMGTRSGDVDPNIQSYLQRVAGMSAEEVNEMLNRRSGLLGVSGVSNDMRAIIQAAGEGYQRATLAIDLFCYRLAKGVLAMAAGLDRVDALVFTGGIGENTSRVRERTLDFLALLRPKLDPALNAVHGANTNGRITSADSGLTCLVIPTSEERAIAACTAEFLKPLDPS